MTEGHRKVLVYPDKSGTSPAIWQALERLVPIRFVEFFANTSVGACDAIVFLSRPTEAHRPLLPAHVPTFSFVGVSSRESGGVNQGSIVSFSASDALDSRVRGREVNHGALKCGALSSGAIGEEVLVSFGAVPVWTRTLRRGFEEQETVLPLPALAAGEHVLDYLNGGHFIQLLPLLHFLRQVSGNDGWVQPKPKATFMFDDPNLHWKSYGFIPYAELVQRGKANRYHTSFATVPLDGWFAHGRTARLFRENPGQLGLLVHGNNHTRAELSTPRTNDEHVALLAQSLRRIVRLEKNSGVSVDRVMAPPHGAYAEATMPALVAVGFDGACISPWSLRDWSLQRDWPAWLGLEPAEQMDGRCFVMPRFRMSADCAGQILISAFLNRPIIPVGHHDTLSGGVELLDRLAGVINSYDGVEWASPAGILRKNFATRRAGSSLHVKPYSNRVILTVPPDVSSVIITAPKSAGQGQDPEQFDILSGAKERVKTRVAAGPSFAARPGDQIEIVTAGVGSIDFRSVKPPPASLWFPVRRWLCEARDRSAPFLPRSKSA